ncbi:MAG TPA: cyclic peptide export ABC transporter [Longimicrobiaceae bacterium]|nr:cyclic peptide export ABC transporter [Longimicrobiaceae bacterium]
MLKNFKQLFDFLVRYSTDARHARVAVVVIIVAGIVSGLSNAALVALINAALTARPAGGAALAWGFAGLCLLLPAARFLSQWLLIRLAERATLDLRLSLSERILSVPLRTLEEVGKSRLLAALTNDVPSITRAIGALPVVCMHLTVVVALLVYLGLLSWMLLLVLLAFMLVGVLAYQIPLLRAIRHLGQVRETLDALYEHFRALIEGNKELKLHRGRSRAFVAELLRPTAEELREYGVRAQGTYVAAASVGQVLFFALVGVVLFVAPTFLDPDGGTLTGYALAVLYMMTPLEVLLNSLPDLSRAGIAVEKVDRLGLSLQASDAAPAERAALPDAAAQWSEIALCGVTHTYYSEREDDTFTLGPCDLVLRPGEVVFVTGGNGSGKTTLIKLLTALYTPEGGELRLDGVPVTGENRGAYRQLFSTVFSDYFLFPGLLGLDAAQVDADARFYLAELHLEHKVRVENGRLSSTDLSQGQRKRLALLTAYLEDRPIYVFDEWAADQDPQFKEIFYRHLLPQLRARGKTAIVISHDDGYYDAADRLVRMDYGQLRYDGPPGAEHAPRAERHPRAALSAVGGD